MRSCCQLVRGSTTAMFAFQDKIARKRPATAPELMLQHPHQGRHATHLYPKKKSSARTWRSGMPSACSTKVAPLAMYNGHVSEMGLPVTMLPPTDAVLRIWLPAKYLSWFSRAVQADISCPGWLWTRPRILSIRSDRVTDEPTHMPSATTCSASHCLVVQVTASSLPGCTPCTALIHQPFLSA